MLNIVSVITCNSFQSTDINECERATATCDPDRAHCLNRDGGYQCKCKVGYTLVGGNCIGKLLINSLLNILTIAIVHSKGYVLYQTFTL